MNHINASKKLLIIGLGKNAERMYKFVQVYNLYEVIGFAVNRAYISSVTFMDLPVYAIEDLESYFNVNEIIVFVALFWNNLNADRKKLYLELKERGFLFANIISPLASIHGEIIGDNVWIFDYVCIAAGSIIGNNVIIDCLSYVGDNTIIENHCFMAAKSLVGGSSRIGEQTFIGFNSTIYDNTIVGKKCLIGARTIINRNLPDFSSVKANCDNQIIKHYGSDTIEKKLQFKKNIR